ncbi:hypothetical protein [Flavobacterium sp. XN-5]|uniref:hypothetical protein n=1 Tax=Flavobacterium sp. XN-5 TaxID=2599390 RepID=UPI001ADDC554|nr:hypothetical protein [Flavobacterium sp. XN-5]
MRFDASFSYTFNFIPTIKASLRGGVINITDEDNVINRYCKINPNNTNKTIEVSNKSLGMTPNIIFRVHF